MPLLPQAGAGRGGTDDRIAVAFRAGMRFSAGSQGVQWGATAARLRGAAIIPASSIPNPVRPAEIRPDAAGPARASGVAPWRSSCAFLFAIRGGNSPDLSLSGNVPAPLLA